MECLLSAQIDAATVGAIGTIVASGIAAVLAFLERRGAAQKARTDKSHDKLRAAVASLAKQWKEERGEDAERFGELQARHLAKCEEAAMLAERVLSLQKRLGNGNGNGGTSKAPPEAPKLPPAGKEPQA